MKQSDKTAKDDLRQSSKLIVWVGIIIALIVVGVVIAFAAYNNRSKVVYQAANACELLTATEAKELLGDKIINSVNQAPVQTDDTATSQCGYTDMNPTQENMIVAAIMVRSGVNDAGVKQNKAEFATSSSGKSTETIKDLGDNAYYNQELGQLNILDGRNWIILSYGVGSTPEANTVKNVVKLAHKILN